MMRWLVSLVFLLGCGLFALAGQEELKYVGVKKCRACHFKEYMKWKKHPKAKTYDRIANEADKELCFKCHTTGYGKPGGFKKP